MSGINQFTIIGALTRAPILRHTPSGMPVAWYVVAVFNNWTDDAGQEREAWDYLPVTTEGAQAELDAQTLTEGSGVAVTGRLRSWFNPTTRQGGMKLIGKLVNRMDMPAHPPQNQGDSAEPWGATSPHDDAGSTHDGSPRN